MSGEVESTSTEGGRGGDAAGYAWMLALVGLTSPVPTAAIIAWMMRLVDTPVERVGSALTVGGQPPQPIGWLWTALPALVIGGGFILAAKAPLAKRVKGFTFLAVNAWLVGLLILGFRFQYPAEADSPFLNALTVAFPLLMLFVIATALWYFHRRILPEPSGGNVGRAKERMDALETGGADG